MQKTKARYLSMLFNQKHTIADSRRCWLNKAVRLDRFVRATPVHFRQGRFGPLGAKSCSVGTLLRSASLSIYDMLVRRENIFH